MGSAKFVAKGRLQEDGGTATLGGLGRITQISLLVVYGILCLLAVIRILPPDRLYLQPFYTGCNLMYLVDVESISDYFESNNNGDRERTRRFLDEANQNDDGFCAQFCVPNVASLGVQYGSTKVLGLPLVQGTCEYMGYGDHVADKTFNYATYSLDVELYQKWGDGYNDDDDDDDQN
eukprot:CAMPEP_0118678700 /NCGR_PEP_ID=MMETSP0800-20121206/3368_1 /TAXON_ID=210618 ORGANISM="Striatella unipunctata, Strain CCMP2910" /NCGR_SAMPLE_ID=MMETSP0800 /ASSEMBLY_ACC=CAM_ASM_000638 /LENGTH=176 /DNA_ID=CAMNT_0006574593 /DNA_START=221 /DNA_END=752 /DNA_ORIENTATION=-